MTPEELLRIALVALAFYGLGFVLGLLVGRKAKE